MTKEETYDTHVYVEDRDRALPVGMYTDEDSEICSIRFSNSFTLNVVTPQDLIDLAQEIETFGRRAMELHYGDNSPRMIAMSEEMARIQEKLSAAAEAEDTVARTMAEETMMKGTVSGPVWKDPSDPVNW